MNFFQRNKRALLVAGGFIALTIILAIVAPYTLPAFYLAFAAPVAGFLGISLPLAWAMFAAGVATVGGFFSGLFTKCFCSPKVEAPAVEAPRQAADNYSYQPVETQPTQQVMLQSIFMPASVDPTQTNNGRQTPGWLMTTDSQGQQFGVYGYGDYLTNTFYQAPPPPPYTATNAPSLMAPVYTDKHGNTY